MSTYPASSMEEIEDRSVNTCILPGTPKCDNENPSFCLSFPIGTPFTPFTHIPADITALNLPEHIKELITTNNISRFGKFIEKIYYIPLCNIVDKFSTLPKIGTLKLIKAPNGETNIQFSYSSIQNIHKRSRQQESSSSTGQTPLAKRGKNIQQSVIPPLNATPDVSNYIYGMSTSESTSSTFSVKYLEYISDDGKKTPIRIKYIVSNTYMTFYIVINLARNITISHLHNEPINLEKPSVLVKLLTIYRYNHFKKWLEDELKDIAKSNK